MKNCIFCKIARKEQDSAKLREDKNTLTILDVNPNTKGMALVIMKKHFESYAVDMADREYTKLFLAAKKAAKMLEKGLEVKRVAIVMEGMGINHAHVKLYPLHGLGSKFSETWAKDRKFFERYLGYISTQLGPAQDIKNLKAQAKEIIKRARQSK